MSYVDLFIAIGFLLLSGGVAVAVAYGVKTALANVGETLASAASLAAFTVVFIAIMYFRYPGFAVGLIYVVVVMICCGIVAWIFREILRQTMPEVIAKPARQAPLTASFGVLVILLYIIFSVVAPILAPYGEAQVFEKSLLLPGDDPAFWLGTDQIGRDILSRLIYGARNTVGIALVTTILAFVLGASLGFLAATVGGWLDQLLSRIVDVMMSIPQLIFALLIITIVGQSTINMILVIAVLDSTRVFRLARAVGLNIVVMDYIEAAKLRGEGLGHLIFKEILPNATAPLLAEFGLRFCFVFLLIAALSFLGLGIQPPLADWGSMVRDLAQFINFATFAPAAAALPLMAAGAIALLTVAVNFVVDWMLHRSSGLKE